MKNEETSFKRGKPPSQSQNWMDGGQRGFMGNHVTANMLQKNRKPPPFWRMIYHPKTMQAAFATSPLAWHCQVKCAWASRQQHRDGTQNSFILSSLRHLSDPCAGTRQSTACALSGSRRRKGLMKSRQGTLSTKMLNQERQSYGKQSERAVTLTLTTSRKCAQPPPAQANFATTNQLSGTQPGARPRWSRWPAPPFRQRGGKMWQRGWRQQRKQHWQAQTQHHMQPLGSSGARRHSCSPSYHLQHHLPSFLLSSMSANKPILMICQRSPRTRWGFPSLKSSAPILTTWQPMADAEFSARFRFSCGQHSQVRHSPGRCLSSSASRVGISPSSLLQHQQLGGNSPSYLQ